MAAHLVYGIAKQTFIPLIITSYFTLFYRGDAGGENVLAVDYMIDVRGTNTRSVIIGPSTRNQRMERQWRDTNERGVRPLQRKFQ